MAPPHRRQRPVARSSRQRLASLFFGIGCLVVLAVTFALGVAAGRRWPSGLPLPGLGGASVTTSAARAERDATRRPETRGLDKDKLKTREPTPVLTFYHDLTVPLTAPPPPARGPAKPGRVEAKTAETARRPPEVASAVEPSVRDADATAVSLPARPPSTGEARFTVQVGSFKLRTQADALRATLAEGGQDVYVTEVEVGGAPQYRVRVGTFATREAARDAATRLANDRHLSTYVTTR